MNALAVRNAIIAAQARAVNVQHALELGDVGLAREELGELDDELARVAAAADEAVNHERNT